MKTENNTATGLSPKQRIFIREMILHGNRRLAYQAAFPDASDTTARINSCKLMKDPAIAQGINESTTEIDRLRALNIPENEIRRIQRIEMMRETLERIMNGELVSKTVITTKTGKIRYVKTTTDVQAMIKAIRNDEKLQQKMDLLETGC